MMAKDLLRVAALIDLPRSSEAGGHVKCWERLATAAAASKLPLDLTVYFSGPTSMEALGPNTRIRHLPPVFSTAKLKFLPYVPDHTDLAPYHRQLARELTSYNVIHTTDGFFAFAKTAERISRAHGIPLVNSFHTDTPSYARIFTHQTIGKIFGGKIFGNGRLARLMTESWKLPERQGRAMEEKLRRHLHQCRYALVTRAEDHNFAEDIVGRDGIRHLRLGVDKSVFGLHRRDRAGIEADYNIPPGHIAILFVGRVDIGKNIYTLTDAIAKLVAQGYPLHLIVAGRGPAMDDVRQRLGSRVSLPGFVEPDELARLYASVDMLALASEVEIRSMAGVEAMASGCPVLVSQKSGVAQLFNNTPAMLPIASGVDAWTAGLRTFSEDPALQRKMRIEATDYGNRHLASWQDVLAEDLFAVWRQAADQSRRTRAVA
jgi:glycosyltransferase involved in cell wall biosynthesis